MPLDNAVSDRTEVKVTQTCYAMIIVVQTPRSIQTGIPRVQRGPSGVSYRHKLYALTGRRPLFQIGVPDDEQFVVEPFQGQADFVEADTGGVDDETLCGDATVLYI